MKYAVCMFIISFAGFIDVGHAVKLFGCEFENEDFALRTNSLWEPKFADEVKPLVLGSMDEFDKLLTKINQLNEEILSSIQLDSVDMLIGLYQAYEGYKKKNRNGRFEDFFKEYQPTLRNDGLVGDSSELPVRLMKRLLEDMPEVVDHLALSTAAMGLSSDFVNSLDHKAEELTHFFVHGHVAGFIRISIGDRLGYILVDPGSALSKAAVLMEDGQAPHAASVRGYGRSNVGETYEFNLPEGGSIYIAARTFEDPGRIHERHLYYVGRPYCSFVGTTLKPNMLYNLHAIVQRGKDGSPKGVFQTRVRYFRKSHLLREKEDPTKCVLATFNDAGKEKKFTYSCESFSKPNKVQQNDLIATSKALNMKPEVLKQKILDLNTISSNTGFIRGLANEWKKVHNPLGEEENVDPVIPEFPQVEKPYHRTADSFDAKYYKKKPKNLKAALSWLWPGSFK